MSEIWRPIAPKQLLGVPSESGSCSHQAEVADRNASLHPTMDCLTNQCKSLPSRTSGVTVKALVGKCDSVRGGAMQEDLDGAWDPTL